ncbi:5413_t:CDS:2 [Ambispora leptoticha]|uniref:5413_t:CDS:1 n=1 Tax=Ambispora leptoticha TaxID=144679 RepID=A0A9N8ZBY1_9GLOM|nr:5413_t:CDS:2 [Ambispora leptoticha]
MKRCGTVSKRKLIVILKASILIVEREEKKAISIEKQIGKKQRKLPYTLAVGVTLEEYERRSGDRKEKGATQQSFKFGVAFTSSSQQQHSLNPVLSSIPAAFFKSGAVFNTTTATTTTPITAAFTSRNIFSR